MRKRFGQQQPRRGDTLRADDELRLLSPSASTVLRNLCDVFALFGELLPDALAVTPALELAAEESQAGRQIARALRDEVRRILREAAGTDDGHPVEAAGATSSGDGNGRAQLDLSGLMANAERETRDVVPAKADAAAAAAAFVGIAGLVAELGYDEHSAAVLPVPLPDGAFALSWTPLSREAADVALLQRVMERLELWTSRERIGALEREASRHWFERFSAPQRTDEGAFAHGVREQEFTFAGRRFVSLGDTVAHSYQVARGRALPAGPRRVLRALVRSRASLFVVRRREGLSVTMEDLRDGRKYAVVEHNESIVYEPGFAALGRLLPRGGGIYLRSPGMVLAEWPEVAAAGAEAVAGSRQRGLAPELLVDGMLAVAQGQRVPRQIRPAPSRTAAREMAYEFSVAMREAGLAREVPVADAPAELRALGSGLGRSLLQMQVDEVLAGWFRALGEQAGHRESGAGFGRGGRPKRRKKKRGG